MLVVKKQYPIKYFALGLERFSHYAKESEDLDPVNELYAYIVAKCYVISEIVVHNKEGSQTKKYGIVPTYSLKENKMIEPIYNCKSECVNLQYTFNVFDKINEAREYVLKVNKEIYNEKIQNGKQKKEVEFDFDQACKIEKKFLQVNNKKNKR